MFSPRGSIHHLKNLPSVSLVYKRDEVRPVKSEGKLEYSIDAQVPYLRPLTLKMPVMFYPDDASSFKLHLAVPRSTIISQTFRRNVRFKLVRPILRPIDRSLLLILTHVSLRYYNTSKELSYIERSGWVSTRENDK